jgi:hypothetical protein
MDVAGDMVRSEGLAFPGGGFQYSGERTPEQAALEDQILAGNITPQTVMAYDTMMKPRLEAVSYKSDFDKAIDIAGPAIISLAAGLMAPAIGAATFPAYAGLASAAFGAGTGALMAGTFSEWEDPAAVLAGAAGGALGGWGGKAVGGAVGKALGGTAPILDSAGKVATAGSDLFNVASGIGGGLGGATGSYLGRSTASGFDTFDPNALLAAAATGATSGGVAGYTQNPLLGQATGAALGGVSDIFGNSTRRRRSPY